MTGQDYLDLLPSVIGDALDQDFTIQLINDTKNDLETELQLEVTKTVNSSGTATVGQDSTTARTLPTDFFLPLTIYVGTDQYDPIPFEHQQFYKNVSGKYWIDHKNGQYHLCGTVGATNTIYFYYQYATPDLETGTLDTWTPVWPSRFHSILLYEIARKYFAFDQSEKVRSWMAEHQMFYQERKRMMMDWDAKLKLTAIGNSTTLEDMPLNSENRINL